MNISKIDLFNICIPLIRSFETSFGCIKERPAIIIKMTADDGAVGYGESSPLSVPISEPETASTGMAFLREYAPKLLGAPIASDYDITALYPSDTHPVSRIGLEGAYLDLLARAVKVTIAEYFGASTPRVPAAESASLRDTPEEVIHEVEEYLTHGVKRIKVKIAPGQDRSIIDAVHRAFPGLCFGLDANMAYSKDDIAHLGSFSADHITFIEQPFHADDYESHALLRQEGLTICLDETVRDLETCRKAITFGSCDMVNIKPARIGSFAEAKRIHDECVASGIRLFGGGRLETGVGKTMNAAFYALSGFTEASDITPPTEYLLADIITPPFSIFGGYYDIPTGPGIGVSVDEEVMKNFLKETFVVEA